MNILIVHKPLNETGGIGGLFASLKKHFTKSFDHFEVGSRTDESSWLMPIRFVNDYMRFIRQVKNKKYDLVHINIAFDVKSVIRDGIFILLARPHCKRIVTYIHGWDHDLEYALKGPLLFLFRLVYNKTDAFIVLAHTFRNTLTHWKFKQPIHLMFTAVDDDLLTHFNCQETMEYRLKTYPLNILFLARIDAGKGVLEAIKAFSLVEKQSKIPLKLIVAGSGSELEKAQAYAQECGIQNISFPGYVRGESKSAIFKQAYIYFFPTFFGEGMPISVLEALAFGIPVITRYEGGLGDFFHNGTHGFITASKDPADFATFIVDLVNNKDLYRKIARHNYNFAKSNCMASSIAKQLEDIYDNCNV